MTEESEFINPEFQDGEKIKQFRDRKPFAKYHLDNSGEIREQVTASVWLNKDGQEKFFELGSRLRLASPSKIFNEAMDIALEKLRGNEKIAEIMYANGRTASRKGLDELDLIQADIRRFLSKTKSKNGELL